MLDTNETATAVHRLRAGQVTEIAGAPVAGPVAPTACGADPDDDSHGGATIDPNDVTCEGCLVCLPVAADVCSTCGGDGSVEYDGFSPARGHFSVSATCPDCGGTGEDADARELTAAQADRADDARAHREVAL